MNKKYQIVIRGQIYNYHTYVKYTQYQETITCTGFYQEEIGEGDLI
jgi:hypothetical protein